MVMFYTEKIQGETDQMEAILFLSMPAHCISVGLMHFTFRPAVISSGSELWHPSPGPLEKVFSFTHL